MIPLCPLLPPDIGAAVGCVSGGWDHGNVRTSVLASIGADQNLRTDANPGWGFRGGVCGCAACMLWLGTKSPRSRLETGGPVGPRHQPSDWPSGVAGYDESGHGA